MGKNSNLPSIVRLSFRNLICILLLSTLASGLMVDGTPVHMIYLKTCKGWCLKKFPVAKEFLEQDFDHYDSTMVEVDYLGGGFPRLVLVDENNENLKTYNISEVSRARIRQVFKALKIKLVKPLRPLQDVDDSKVKIWKKFKYENVLLNQRKKIVREKQKLKLHQPKMKKCKTKWVWEN